jgi:hypothetical protein
MSGMKYPCHCLNDIFGYCAKNLQGEGRLNGAGIMTYWRTPAITCEKNWQECSDYVKYTSVVKVEVLAEPQKAEKEKKAK